MFATHSSSLMAEPMELDSFYDQIVKENIHGFNPSSDPPRTYHESHYNKKPSNTYLDWLPSPPSKNFGHVA